MEQLLTGLGLSGSSGLNAYIPLLSIGIMQRLELIDMAAPYDTLSSPIVLIVLAILLVIEMGADKIPAVDSANDAIQTFIRPTAGAIVFAASTSNVKSIDEGLLLAMSIIAGTLTAGSVHVVKALVRPGITLSTGGMGNMFVSFIEDLISVLVSVFAVLIPFLVVIFSMSLAALTGWLLWDIRRTRRYFGRDAAPLPSMSSIFPPL